MDLKMVCMEQTGMALIEVNGLVKCYPLFSLVLFKEGMDLAMELKGTLKLVLATDDCLNFTLEEEIKDRLKKGYLSEQLMSELRDGFSEVYGWTGEDISTAKMFYA